MFGKKENLFIVSDIMSDGGGGYRPVPTVLNEDDAILFLRLDTRENDPHVTLTNLIKQGKIKAKYIGKEKGRPLFCLKELKRFIEN